MSRLTDYEGAYCFMRCVEEDGDEDKIRENCKIYKACLERKMYDKLTHYEDLEEAGRLIELPFDIGDIVYVIRFSPYQIVEFQVSEIKKNKFCWWFKTGKNMASFTFNDLGNWVFLTKAEAEAKLAELKGGAE